MTIYHLSFYVPESHLEEVKQAVFDAGAGRLGQYDSCAWQTLGQGQYRPLKGSNPSSGEQDVLSKVREYKVEMICQEDCIKTVVSALKDKHPYEEVAYQIIKLDLV